MNRRKDIYVILGVLLLAVVGLSVGYAAVSSTLSWHFSSVKQSPLNWNIGFVGDSASPIVSGTSSIGRGCGMASVTPSTVSVTDTLLSKPQDKCTYELVIENSGDIDAKVSSITAIRPNYTTCTSTNGNMVCGNITYRLTTDLVGDNILPINTVLEAGSKMKVYLAVSYTGDELNLETSIQSGGSFLVVYAQA